MEIRQLRYFVAMAQAGSLMKASEQLHIAQPALSVHLSNLEAELGVKLVERSNRGIKLTEEGENLLERAKHMLSFHDQTVQSLAKPKAATNGRITLGLPSTLPGLIAPALYASFARDLPDVTVYMMDASTAALYEWINAGRLDIAILCGPPEHLQLECEHLYVEDLCLVGSPALPGFGEEIDFDDMLSLKVAMPCTSSSWRRVMDIAAAENGRTLKSFFETESTSALRALALSGQCYVVLPGSSVQNEVADGTLLASRIVNPDMRGHKSIARLNAQPATSLQRSVWNLTARVIRQVMSESQCGLPSNIVNMAPRIAPGSLLSRSTVARPFRSRP